MNIATCDETVGIVGAEATEGELVVVRETTGYGMVGRDGELGYEGLQVTLPSDWPRYRLISAHAPSEIDIVTTRPLAVTGFLNITSRFRGECRFWVDENWLGDAFYPGQRTREIMLDPGFHQLHVTTPDKDNRHTVWGLRPIERAGRCINDDANSSAVPANTAVIVISTYERSRGRHLCQFLTASARRQGIYLHFRGMGEKYDHFESKVVKLRRWIEELPSHYANVLYVDARDVLFLRGLDDCCAALNRCAKPILIGAERGCWPVFENEWRESFPQHPSNRRWPNAGVFMGRRKELTETLKLLKELSESRDVPIYGKYWDDQFLWQWAWLRGLAPIAVDYDCDLVANISTHDTRIYADNPDFMIGSELIVRDSGLSPPIAHFSGAAADQVMHHWAGFLQVV